MSIKDLFCSLFGKKQQKECKDNKTRVRKIGDYRPKCRYVRIDNVAKAAGVPCSIVREFAKKHNCNIYKFKSKSGSYLYAGNAVILHTIFAGK